PRTRPGPALRPPRWARLRPAGAARPAASACLQRELRGQARTLRRRRARDVGGVVALHDLLDVLGIERAGGLGGAPGCLGVERAPGQDPEVVAQMRTAAACGRQDQSHGRDGYSHPPGGPITVPLRGSIRSHPPGGPITVPLRGSIRSHGLPPFSSARVGSAASRSECTSKRFVAAPSSLPAARKQRCARSSSPRRPYAKPRLLYATTSEGSSASACSSAWIAASSRPAIRREKPRLFQ